MKSMGAEKKVTAVVVTYNRKALLRECLEALLFSECPCDIVVVDNASTDGTEQYVADLAQDPRVKYINSGENLGGAGGFNIGIKEAMKAECDYIWLMDDDCIVGRDSLRALLKAADAHEGKFGFLSGVVKCEDGSICDMNVQRSSMTRDIKDFSREGQRLFFATFVSLFLSRTAIERCGLPIKEFFIWGDDWEYTSRISRKFTSYLAPESVVVHKCENRRVDIVHADPRRLERYFYTYRNEKYLFKKLGMKGRLYFSLKIVYHFVKLLFAKDRRDKLAVMRKGLRAARTFDPSVEMLPKRS